jgi:hypothetical protein
MDSDWNSIKRYLHFNTHFFFKQDYSKENVGFICFKIKYTQDMELKRVVVTGLGALTLGNNVQEYWNALVMVSWASITYFDASKFKTQFACELKNFNVEDFIDRKKLEKWTDTLSMQWFLVMKQ